MMNRFAIIMLVCVVVLPMSGCSLLSGDSMLFATSSNFGLDIDTAPRNLTMSYARQEGVIAPEYPNGEVPSVLTTFGKKDVFQASNGFATGKASIILAKGLGNDKKIGLNDKDLDSTITFDTKIKDAPKKSCWAKFWGIFIKDKKAKQEKKIVKQPFFFYTKDAWGLDTKWTAGGGAPQALSFGHKRQEVAYVHLPLQYQEAEAGYHVTVKPPSLLAMSGLKIDNVANLSTFVDRTLGLGTGNDGGKDKDLRVNIDSFFATGKAADQLAANKIARATIVAPAFLGKKTASKLAAENARQIEVDIYSKQKKIKEEIEGIYAHLDENMRLALREAAKTLCLSQGIEEDDFQEAIIPNRKESDLKPKSDLLEEAKKLKGGNETNG